jgi:hypothetical protein
MVHLMTKETVKMAKETTKKVEEKAEEVKKEIIPVEPEKFGSLTLKPYNENAVADFGNSFVFSLVAAAGMEAAAQAALAAAGEAKQYLGFEMTRAIFDLATKHKDGKDAIDVYNVFGEAKDVERLNTRVLMHLGVVTKEIDEDDNVVYNWTDKKIESLYKYTKELKEKDKEEHDKRFNNRKRLNARLSDAYKAVAILMDNKLSPDDLFYSEDPESGAMLPTIRNAPKEIGGTEKVIQLGARKPVSGADLSPTMSSLINLANKKHKEPKTDRADKGEKREGEAKMGMTDEAFGNIVNTLRRAITAQEGVFTADMQKQIKNLKSFIDPIIAEMK